MASYNELLALIDAYINQNGVQAITGQVLNGVLRAMVDQLGRGYAIMGAADPTTDPGTPDGPETWFASVPGTYTNFDGIQIVDGELALLSYEPSTGFSKNTIYEGFQTVQATIDGNVGTPAVGVSYANGILSFDFHNMKGVTGDPAGFGAVTASVDSNIGTPSVQVQTSGPDTAKAIAFQFHNLKGETGVTSVLATVDNTSGNPQCAVSLNGQQLVLNFTGLKGAQGDTGSSVDYPFTIVNNLTTNDPAQALSAAMGVQLESEVSQLEAEVDKIKHGGATNPNIPYDIEMSNKIMNVKDVGTVATEEAGNTFGYAKIPVTTGDVFQILAVGNATGKGRAFALTDENLIVLKNTSHNYADIPAVVEVEQDGFLIVNNTFNGLPTPEIVLLKNGYPGDYSLENNGRYAQCNTVGVSVTGWSAISNWGGISVPVLKGQKVTIYTRGGATGRAWAILGEENEVQSNAVANLDASSNPAILDIEENGVLIINNNFTNFSAPTYKIENEEPGEIEPNLDDHEERITKLEGTIKTQLNILAVGNSFTENSLEYMPGFLNDLVVPNVTIYRATISGSSLSRWWTAFSTNETISPVRVVGRDIEDIGNTLKDVLSHNWDIIVFQQVSTDSGDYNTIEPYLYKLIANARMLCTNVNVKVAWHLTWSLATEDSNSGPHGVVGYGQIAETAEQILDYYRLPGIDIVIPSGTAIQNARGTSLNNSAELTKDGRHASAGVAKYILTATWYKVLIESFSGKRAVLSSLNISATSSSSDPGAESVTDSNRALCLKCVEYATGNKFHISEIDE